MKIFYVEDEVSDVLERVENLFEERLEETISKELKELKSKKEEINRPVNAEEIKQILNKSQFIEFENDFPEALRKIKIKGQKYSLLIIDRNLSGKVRKYNLEDLDRIAQRDISENGYENREGDYLLKIAILSKQINAKDRFYFLTGNSSDEIKNLEVIKPLIEGSFDNFKKGNIIDKTDTKEKENLKEIINNLEELDVLWENKKYLETLENFLNKNAKEVFFKTLRNKDKNVEIIENLDLIRNLSQKILSKIAEITKAPNSFNRINNRSKEKEKIFLYERDKINVKVRPFISWLSQEKKIKSGELITTFAKTIQGLASEFGPHDDSSSHSPLLSFFYQPTTNTVNSLIFALKEIILWFGEVCEQEKKL
ncbi:MAG: hypothetical protein DWQ06_05395 [Calditrichaeota bacterium]|nr:MAG: hypothetical protein DWQ06_05395 [Calditrichota bacterium]